MYAGKLFRFLPGLFALCCWLVVSPNALGADRDLRFRITSMAGVNVIVRLYHETTILQRTAVGPGLSVFDHGGRPTGTQIKVMYGPENGPIGESGYPVTPYEADPGPYVITEGSGPFIAEFTVYGGPPPPSNKQLNLRTCNGSAVPQTYSVVVDNIVQSTFSLQPGDCDVRSVGPYPENALPTVKVIRSSTNPDGTQNNDVENTATEGMWGDEGDLGADGMGTNDGGKLFPAYGTGDDDNDPLTPPPEPPVDFGDTENTSDLAKEKTLQRVGNSLYTALSGGFAESIEQERRIKSAVDQVKGAVNSGNTTLGSIYSRLNDVNSTIANGNGKLDTINNSIGTLNSASQAKLNEIKAAIEANGGKLGSIDISAADIRTVLNANLPGIKENTLATTAAVNASTNVTGAINSGVAMATNQIAAMINKMQSYKTNTDEEMAAHEGAANTFSSTTVGAINSLAGQNGTAIGLINSTTFSPSTMFQVSLPVLGGVIDFNPMNQPLVAEVAPWIRSFNSWAISLGIVLACFAATFSTLQASGSWAQVHGLTGATPIAGLITGSVTAIGYRLVIGLALAALPAFFLVWGLSNASIYNLINGNPLAGAHPVASGALWFLDQFLPVILAVTAPLIVLSYKTGLMAVIYAKQMIIKWLPAS